MRYFEASLDSFSQACLNHSTDQLAWLDAFILITFIKEIIFALNVSTSWDSLSGIEELWKLSLS